MGGERMAAGNGMITVISPRAVPPRSAPGAPPRSRNDLLELLVHLPCDHVRAPPKTCAIACSDARMRCGDS